MRLCNSCKRDLPETDFYVRKAGATGRYVYACKNCNKTKSKEYRHRNLISTRKAVKKSKDKRLAENRQKILEYLSIYSCVDCGESNPIVLEFDHVRGKKKLSLSKMLSYGNSWERILEEISKCEIRCANCHRIRTAKSRKYYRHWMAQERSGAL